MKGRREVEQTRKSRNGKTRYEEGRKEGRKNDRKEILEY